MGYLYDYRRHIKPSDEAIAKALPAVSYQACHPRPSGAQRAFHAGRGASISEASPRAGRSIAASKSCAPAASSMRLSRRAVTLCIIGDRFGEPWMVGIRDPRQQGKVIARIRSLMRRYRLPGTTSDSSRQTACAITTSSRRPPANPPARCAASPSLARTRRVTDGLSKTIFVLGIKEGMRVLDALGDVDVIAIDKDEKIYHSKGLARPERSNRSSSAFLSCGPANRSGWTSGDTCRRRRLQCLRVCLVRHWMSERDPAPAARLVTRRPPGTASA